MYLEIVKNELTRKFSEINSHDEMKLHDNLTVLQPRNGLPFKIEGPFLFLFNLNFFCIRLRLKKHRYVKHVEYFSCTSKMWKCNACVILWLLIFARINECIKQPKSRAVKVPNV